MKKLFIAALLVGTASMASAQFVEDRAQTETQAEIVSPYVISSIEKVRQMPDETYVTVQGHIIAQKGHDKEKFLFKDDSGEIMVEVDKKVWRHQPVTPETTVKILGELDQSRDPHRVKIEAVYLEVIP